VTAQEAQGLSNGHHGEDWDNIEADEDELHWVLHVAWRVPHVSSEQTGQMLGQAVSWGAGGAHDKPKGGAFLVDIR
jgi:hypothetical protein